MTVFLIGEHSSEKEGFDTEGRDQQAFIRKELQATLYDRKDNRRSGLLGIVLPQMYDEIYKGKYSCNTCGKEHNYVNINDSTVIREFSTNYYMEPHDKCAYSEDERYAILVKWDNFIKEPELFIERAFEKRTKDIAKKVRVYIK